MLQNISAAYLISHIATAVVNQRDMDQPSDYYKYFLPSIQHHYLFGNYRNSYSPNQTAGIERLTSSI